MEGYVWLNTDSIVAEMVLELLKQAVIIETLTFCKEIKLEVLKFDR